jgi:hypothetical protein
MNYGGIYMKKFSVMIIALSLSLLLPTSVFANSGKSQIAHNSTSVSTVIDDPIQKINESSPITVEPQSTGWDPVGSQDLMLYSSGATSNVYYSTGGDFEITFRGLSSSNGYYVHLYEEDETNDDDPVGDTLYGIGDHDFVWRNISQYCDGDNGKAEFYLRVVNPTKEEWATIHAYD